MMIKGVDVGEHDLRLEIKQVSLPFQETFGPTYNPPAFALLRCISESLWNTLPNSIFKWQQLWWCSKKSLKSRKFQVAQKVEIYLCKKKLEQKSVFKRKNQHRNINNIQKK